jgi:hypothetical protein
MPENSFNALKGNKKNAATGVNLEDGITLVITIRNRNRVESFSVCSGFKNFVISCHVILFAAEA